MSARSASERVECAPCVGVRRTYSRFRDVHLRKGFGEVAYSAREVHERFIALSRGEVGLSGSNEVDRLEGVPGRVLVSVLDGRAVGVVVGHSGSVPRRGDR